MKILILSILLALLYSCGADKKANVATTLQVNLGYLSNGNSSFSNGLIIMGHRLDDSESFQIPVFGNELNLNLANGLWEFAVVAWKPDGVSDELFQGINLCAYSGVVNVAPPTLNLNFQVSAAKCDFIAQNGEKLSSSFATTGTNQFHNLKIQACENINGIAFGDSCPNAASTGTRSIRVVAKGEMKSPRFGKKVFPAYSKCLAYDPTGPYYIDTAMKIPVGDDTNSILKVDIELYGSIDCSGDFVNYNFRDGLDQTSWSGNLDSTFITSGDYGYLFLEKNSLTATVLAPLEVHLTITGGYLTYYCNKNNTALSIAVINNNNSEEESYTLTCNTTANSESLSILNSTVGDNLTFTYSATALDGTQITSATQNIIFH